MSETHIYKIIKEQFTLKLKTDHTDNGNVRDHKMRLNAGYLNGSKILKE